LLAGTDRASAGIVHPTVCQPLAGRHHPADALPPVYPPLFLDSECRELGSENTGCDGISETLGDNIAAFNASAAPVVILNPSRTVPVVHIVELPAKAAQRHEHFDSVRKISLD
jgi:hypothetical protein